MLEVSDNLVLGSNIKLNSMETKTLRLTLKLSLRLENYFLAIKLYIYSILYLNLFFVILMTLRMKNCKLQIVQKSTKQHWAIYVLFQRPYLLGLYLFFNGIRLYIICTIKDRKTFIITVSGFRFYWYPMVSQWYTVKYKRKNG